MVVFSTEDCTRREFRLAFLLENSYTSDSRHNSLRICTNEPRKYVEYQGGQRELYDLSSDPYELQNAYSGTPPQDLESRLVTSLKECAGDSCRAAKG